MKNIYQKILKSKAKGQKLLAILLDPDKLTLNQIPILVSKIKSSPATHVFVGGSSFSGHYLDDLISDLKSKIKIPIVLFPGNPSQISDKADGILFLTLISGRNPDYLIEHQIHAVPILKKTKLEVISTGYMLIESGSTTAVERVSKTEPMLKTNPNFLLQTAQAGELLGNKLIYLEAGSGAAIAIPKEIIKLVSQNINIPLIVGGGIRNLSQIQEAFLAGADLVVIGTAFENDPDFFKSYNKIIN